jgi:hypothetical protein
MEGYKLTYMIAYSIWNTSFEGIILIKEILYTSSYALLLYWIDPHCLHSFFTFPKLKIK